MKPLVRNPEIVWRVEQRKEQDVLQALEEGREVSDLGTVILIRSGTMHQLNLVGGRIWQLCDGKRTLDEVVGALAAEFEADREELSGDVREFVEDLVQRGWLSYG